MGVIRLVCVAEAGVLCNPIAFHFFDFLSGSRVADRYLATSLRPLPILTHLDLVLVLQDRPQEILPNGGSEGSPPQVIVSTRHIDRWDKLDKLVETPIATRRKYAS